MNARKLPRKKLALLHVAKAQLDLDDDDYRRVLREAAGVESARELDEHGFEAVLHEFEHLGFKSTRMRQSFGVREGMATAGQVALIRRLWQEYARQPTERAMNHWMESHFHVSALRFVDATIAQKVITALRVMGRKRPTPPQAG